MVGFIACLAVLSITSGAVVFASPIPTELPLSRQISAVQLQRSSTPKAFLDEAHQFAKRDPLAKKKSSGAKPKAPAAKPNAASPKQKTSSSNPSQSSGAAKPANGQAQSSGAPAAPQSVGFQLIS
jgi:hypothetical protein